MGVSDCVPEQGRYCIKVRITIKTVKIGFDQFSTDTMAPFQVAEVRAVKGTMVSQSLISHPNTTGIPSVIIQGQGPV